MSRGLRVAAFFVFSKNLAFCNAHWSCHNKTIAPLLYAARVGKNSYMPSSNRSNVHIFVHIQFLFRNG